MHSLNSYKRKMQEINKANRAAKNYPPSLYARQPIKLFARLCPAENVLLEGIDW